MNTKSESTHISDYSFYQMLALVALRMLIGWHFLYEGIAKLTNPFWSAQLYLNSSEGLFSGFFKWLAADPALLQIVDFLNMWGLTLIGAALILGIFTRYFCYAGVFMLALYYLAAPPFIGYSQPLPAEGSYLLVNKNLIELTALLVLAVFPTSHITGLDRLLKSRFGKDG